MGLFDLFQGSRDEFDNTHHASLTHEALGGAVAFEAMKAYEDHRAKNGNPDNHALAKEIAAGLAGAAFDRLVETKGLDAYDNYQARRAQAVEQAQIQINERFTEDVYNNY